MRRPFVLALALLTSCGGDSDPYAVTVGPYDATIKRTAYGVPHIVADDVPSVMYGTGYAFAQDHVCTLADLIVKVNSERSLYFGRGQDDANFQSDVVWKALRVVRDAEELWFDVPKDVQDALVAYAAGYNRYLSDVGPSGLPTPCRDAEWVRPITHIDLLAHYLHLGQMGSGFYMHDFIATAAPPYDPNARRRARPLEELGAALHPDWGSNGMALGSEMSASGGGLVVSNTHFEAEGERRWYELHQTVPGELDVYGIALMGVPLVNVGMNEHVAWTHTVSTTPRFILYQLQLEPGDPTRYLYDGSYRPMEREDVVIAVRNDDGTLEQVTHSLYRSHYGPMLDAPLIGWSGQVAFTYRDVNVGNINMIPTWWAMNRATDIDELEAAQSNAGIPWVHTMAADSTGQAYYADSAAAPDLSAETEAAYREYVGQNFLAAQFQAQGAYVFDGSDPTFEWNDSEENPTGAMDTSRHPRLRTRQYVANSNENHWLASDQEPLEGYPMVFGQERAPRQGRTKGTLRFASGELSNPGPDGLFDIDELTSSIVSYPSHHADRLREPLAQWCEALGTEPVRVEWGGNVEFVDVSPACPVLAAWDGHYTTDARGAHLFREWIGSGDFDLGTILPFLAAGDLDQQGALFTDDFDPDAPLATPAALPSTPDPTHPISTSLAKALLQLRDAGIALDARLGDIQFRHKGGVRTSCPGGREVEGSVFIADWRNGISTLLPRDHVPRGAVLNRRTGLTAEGYPVNGGDSWVAALSVGPEGPSGEAVLIYSQSADPDSPHFNDQAALHAAGAFRPILFDQADVDADPELEVTVLSEKKSKQKATEG